MHVTDLIDTQLLEKMVREGYVRTQTHPQLPLHIYNYSEKAQYERLWNEVTLCTRGLVLDEHGEIVILPLEKFFNYAEHTSLDELPDPPEESFLVQEKLDGSLFLARQHPKYGLVTASRGSFVSDQAQKGTELLSSFADRLRNNLSYIFEVIYPENRIVVDYGNREELVLLSVRHHYEGELPVEHVNNWGDFLGVRTPKLYEHIDDLNAAKDYVPDNEEGYVIRFDSGLRMKIKGDEYVRLHRIVTGINSKHIWEWLRDGRDINEVLVDVPDEFYNWVEKTADELQGQHDEIMRRARQDADMVRHMPTRKGQANIIKVTPYPGVAFALLDGNEDKASDGVWKMIKPKASWPFKVDEG